MNDKIQHALHLDLCQESWTEQVHGRLPRMTDTRQVLDLPSLHLTADPA